MKELKRTQVGEFEIENSITIQELENNLDKYFENPDEIIKRSFEAGVENIVIPASDPRDFERINDICKRYSSIYWAPGVHPLEVENFKDDNEEKIRNSIETTIKERDEDALIGLGVLFELLWNKLPQEDKEKSLKYISESIKDLAS